MKKLICFAALISIVGSCSKSSDDPPILPTVYTSRASAITSKAATTGGRVTSDGRAAITERGVYYKTSIVPSAGGSKVISGNGTGDFTVNLTGLTENTTYYIQAYAVNSAGTGVGQEFEFTTEAFSGVTIGTQIWMLKNLDVTTYGNGELIPQVTDQNLWVGLTTGAWCWYNNDSITYAAVYGKLYNWYALNDPRGLAPTGWHIPSDAEWTTLSTFLGGEAIAGGPLKEPGTVHWLTPNTEATNNSGFTALPGGFRSNNGAFFNLGGNGGWWSATEDVSTFAFHRNLNYNLGSIYRGSDDKIFGFSVRCVKD